LISKIKQLSDRIFAKLLREYETLEINPAQGRVMFPLWRQDNISFHELRKKTLLSKATLSHMLDNLEKAGYIERVPSEEDKRTINIILTKRHKDELKRYLEVSNEMKELTYKGFNDKEIDEFEYYLRRLLNNLTEYSEKNK